MSPERFLELIHAEVDRTLSSQERAELNGILLSDPEARRQRDELARTCSLLDGLEPVALPDDFTRTVIDSLEKAGVLPAPRRSRAPWQWLMQPELARYAAAFGAGIVMTSLVIGTGSLHDPDREFENLAGTMLESSQIAPGAKSTMQFDLERLSGKVELRRSEHGSLTMLEFELQSAEPLEVVAEFNGQAMHFQRSASQNGHFGLILSEATTEVTLRFLVAGDEVQQGVLRSTEHG